MDHFHWSEYWDAIKGSLEKNYRFLNEEDLHYEQGEEDLLMNTLMDKFGASSSQINDLLFLHLICADHDALAAEPSYKAYQVTNEEMLFNA